MRKIGREEKRINSGIYFISSYISMAGRLACFSTLTCHGVSSGEILEGEGKE